MAKALHSVFRLNRDPDSVAATAVTYRACSKLLFSDGNNYTWAVLENVSGLGQKDGGNSNAMSDAEFIIADFQVHSWSCMEADVEAAEYGSAALRNRKLFIALKGTGKDVAARMGQISQWLQVMKIGNGSVSNLLVSEAVMTNRFLKGLPECVLPTKKPKTSQDSWQYAHMLYFEFCGVAWPPSRVLPSEFHASCAQLSERELEIVILANSLHSGKDQDKSLVYSLDCNDEIKRHFGVLPESAEEKVSLRMPWKYPLLNTLVGSSHIVVRLYVGDLILLER